MLMSTPKDPNTQPRDVVAADLCILGAGPGGLALAERAATAGLDVVLIEKHKLGGTSLNYGSQPLNALLATAHRAHDMRTAKAFAIAPVEPILDRAALQDQITSLIEQSTPNATLERLTGLGIRVIRAAGRFTDKRTIAAADYIIPAKRFVIATGSTPRVPIIPGLDALAYHTTDTLPYVSDPVEHLIIVGGGAAGVSFAQAFRRLGSRVTILDRSTVLSRIDDELASVIKKRLIAEGIALMEGATVQRLEGGRDRVWIEATTGLTKSRLEGTHLLIACGRTPVMAEIGLEAAGIKVDDEGIKVDRRLRTSNRRVYAIGDATGFPCSTQRAQTHAALVGDLIVQGSIKGIQENCIPQAIYTDPEFASVGLSEADARKIYPVIQVFRHPLQDNARALASRMPMGLIKVIVNPSGAIVGAGIVGRSASELIGVWSLAVSQRLSMRDMAHYIPPFPSLGDVSRQAASQADASASSVTLAERIKRLLAR